MKPLFISGTATTPSITLDPDANVFEISGRSVADNPGEVYLPVFHWLNQYAKDPKTHTNLICKLEYINTASSKVLLDLISALSFIKNSTVVWYYQEDDEDMKEAGEEFFELANIPFEFKTY